MEEKSNRAGNICIILFVRGKQRRRERERVRVRVRVREGPELERVFEGRHWREPRRAGQKPQEISM